MDDILDEIESEMGIDLRSIERIEMFLDLDATLLSSLSVEELEDLELEDVAMPSMGVALYGGPGTDVLLNELLDELLEVEGDAAARGESYRGHEIYADPIGDLDGFAFSFTDTGALLLGSVGGVKAMIDIAAGDSPPGLDPLAWQALGEMDGRHLGMALSLSEELLAEMVAEAGGEDLGMLSLLDPTAMTAPVTVLALRMGDDDVTVFAREFFESEEDAVVSMEYQQGTLAMVGAMAGSPALLEIVDGMEITRDGVEVAYRMTITVPQMQEIFGLLLGLSELMAGGPQS